MRGYPKYELFCYLEVLFVRFILFFSPKRLTAPVPREVTETKQKNFRGASAGALSITNRTRPKLPRNINGRLRHFTSKLQTKVVNSITGTFIWSVFT